MDPITPTVLVMGTLFCLNALKDMVPGINRWRQNTFYYIDTYEAQYTPLIDEFIMNSYKINDLSLNHGEENTPSGQYENYHYGQYVIRLATIFQDRRPTITKGFWFYIANFFNVHFIKSSKEVDGSDVWFYTIFWPYMHIKWYDARDFFDEQFLHVAFKQRLRLLNITPKWDILDNISVIENVENGLNVIADESMVVYQLNSVEINPIIIHSMKVCPTALYSYQKKLLKQILYQFIETRNVKVLISSIPGKGKSIMGRVVKQFMDQIMPGYNCRVFEGIDLSVPRFSLDMQILKKTLKPTQPSIIVIDEVDKFFEQSVSTVMERASFQGRSHVSNKQSMVKVLDNIAETPNVITIYTTNESLKDMRQNYSPYIRQGRMDILIEF